MDPDAALEEIRECLADYRRAEQREDPDAVSHALERLAEVTEGLDAWISKGGFPPQAWRKIRTLTDLEGRRVARVTFAVSNEARTTGLTWHDLQPQAREYWAGIASTAINEYLTGLDYRPIPVGDTNAIVPGRDRLR